MSVAFRFCSILAVERLQALWGKPDDWHNAAPRGSRQGFGELASPSGSADDDFSLAAGARRAESQAAACFLGMWWRFCRGVAPFTRLFLSVV